MKPTRIGGVRVRLLASIALLAAMSATPPARSQDSAQGTDAAVVLSASGATTLVGRSSVSTPLRTDVPIRSGDLIRTGSDGRVQLRFTDGALISIQPDSDFRVERYAFDARSERGFFELARGAVRTVSGRIGKRDRDDWRLTTPTATIGIRGTEFSVEEVVCLKSACAPGVEPGLTVSVVSGRVAVSNRGGAIEVPAGATLRLRDATTVPSSASLSRPARQLSGSPGAPVGVDRSSVNVGIRMDTRASPVAAEAAGGTITAAGTHETDIRSGHTGPDALPAIRWTIESDPDATTR